MRWRVSSGFRVCEVVCVHVCGVTNACMFETPEHECMSEIPKHVCVYVCDFQACVLEKPSMYVQRI